MSHVPGWALRVRGGWQHTGRVRPERAESPGSGQESVWDYPRPPRIEDDAREVVVRLGVHEIARSCASIRVLETASPPTFYLPAADVHLEYLESREGTSYCEWKGEARYWDVVVPGRRIETAAWSYPDPLPGFERLREHFAFYAARVECFVGGTRAEPQPGRFYGGWVTPEIVGPFKGEPGTSSW